MSAPTGIGIYMRELSESTHGTPKSAARIARDHGVSFVALLACWQDERGHRARNVTKLPAFAEELAKVGVTPWIWGYPKAGMEKRFVERMRAASEPPIAGWILDPEVSYKGRPWAAKRLVKLTTDALSERLGLGVTSYGLPRAHPSFPWREFGGVGWGSPQLYGSTPAQVKRGVADWRARGWEEIVPSVAAFGPRSDAQLDGCLARFAQPQDVAGLIVWSWPQISPEEWRVLPRWANRI